MKMFRKPVIISISKDRLTIPEKTLIQKEKPWGIILFSRNIKTFQQLKKLTNEIRKSLKDPFYPILIDEEGGDVSRLSSLINTKEFSQQFFGTLFESNSKNGELIYRYYINSISAALKTSGININTIPVLDLLRNKTHKILKSRCFSKNPTTIKNLGDICIKTLKENKIGSVAKHVPGHGCVNTDSHKKLPITNDDRSKLYSQDFKLFKNLNSNFLMTAHVLYKKIDSKFVATQSKKIISEIIRKKLNFKGLIISDDISMKALKGNILVNAKLSLSAGCNLILHCNGNIKESAYLLKNLDKIDTFTEKKTEHFYQFLR